MAVMGAQSMRNPELLEPEYPNPPPSQVTTGCGSHGADAHDDHVKSLLHNRTFLLARYLGPKNRKDKRLFQDLPWWLPRSVRTQPFAHILRNFTSSAIVSTRPFNVLRASQKRNTECVVPAKTSGELTVAISPFRTDAVSPMMSCPRVPTSTRTCSHTSNSLHPRGWPRFHVITNFRYGRGTVWQRQPGLYAGRNSRAVTGHAPAGVGTDWVPGELKHIQPDKQRFPKDFNRCAHSNSYRMKRQIWPLTN